MLKPLRSNPLLDQNLRAGCRPVLLIVLILLIVLPVAAMASLGWVSIFNSPAGNLLANLWLPIVGVTPVTAALLRCTPGFEQILRTSRRPLLLLKLFLLLHLWLFGLYGMSPIGLIISYLLSIAVMVIAATPLRSDRLIDPTLPARRWPSARMMVAMLIAILIGAMMEHWYIVPLIIENLFFTLCLVWSLSLVMMVGTLIILRSNPLSDPTLRARRRLLLLTMPVLLSALFIGAIANWDWLIHFIITRPHNLMQMLPSLLSPLPIVMMAIAAAPLYSSPPTDAALRAARWPLPRVAWALLISVIVIPAYRISRPPAMVGTVLPPLLLLLSLVAMAVAAAPLFANPLLRQTIRASGWPSPRMTWVVLIVLLIGATVGRGWLIDHQEIEAMYALPTDVTSMLVIALFLLLPLVTLVVAATSTARRLHAESFQLLERSPLNYPQVIWGLGLGTIYTLRGMMVLAFSLLVIMVDTTSAGTAAQMALLTVMLHLAASMLGASLSRAVRLHDAPVSRPLQAASQLLPRVALVLLITLLIGSMMGGEWLIGLLPFSLRVMGWPLLWLLPLITIAVIARPLRSNPLLDETIRASRRPSLRTTLLLLAALLVVAMVARGWLPQHLPSEFRRALLLLPWLLPLVTLAVAARSAARRRQTESFQLVKQSLRDDLQVSWGLGLGTLYNLRVVLALAFGLLFALVDEPSLRSSSTVLGLTGLHLAASMLGTGLSSVLRLSGAPVRMFLPSNPLVEQTIHASRWPSLRTTLLLLAALFIGAVVGRAWLIAHLPAGAHAALLLLLWLLPMATMAIAAVSTARRLRTEGFQLVRQSPLTDRQITWGLGLGTLYTLRVVLVLAFGLLPALVDDTLLGGTSAALWLAGLHLAAAMIGTQMVLRWGWQRLGVVLAIVCCASIFTALPAINTLPSPMPAQVCQLTTLNPTTFRLDALLFRWKLSSPLPMSVAAVLPILIGWLASLPPWRDRSQDTRLRLETSGLVLIVGVAVGLGVMLEAGKHQALATINESLSGHSLACGHVRSLELDNANLQGELPLEIGQLTSLERLSLHSNRLTTLPPQIGRLTSLQELDLSRNQLTTLPPEIGRLTSLTALTLHNNKLTTLPPEIGRLTSLTALTLNNNQFTTLPPEIGQLTNLTSLDLASNRLAVLPPDIGRLTNLKTLGLHHNQLTELPPEIGQLTNLPSLDLSSNQLALLPPEIGQLTQLTSLGLSNNQLAELPPEIGQLTQLTSLALSNNQLAELPPEIGRLTQLTSLALSNNQLTGLPPEIARLTRLQQLDLSGNQRTKLPPEVGRLTNLQELNLSDNQLTELPPEIGQLAHLATLSLANNQFTDLPPDLGQLNSLTYLDLSKNQFTRLSPEIAHLTHLTHLVLSNNPGIELPPEIGYLTHLTDLDLKGSQLAELPPEFGQLTNLTNLNLANNHLTELPPEIGQLTQLVILDLSYNNLTELSPEMSQLTQLADLNLIYNDLSELSPEICQLTHLGVLSLSFNHLTELPPEIGQLTSLYRLELNNNQLTELPPEIGQITTLRQLDLYNNQLKELPPEICQLPHLSIDAPGFCNR